MTTAWPLEAYAVKYGLGRAIGFGVLSFGGWGFYWFHRNRRLLDAELRMGRDDALLHTLGLFVPVLNVFVTYWLWRDLNALRARYGLAGFPAGPYAVASAFLAPVFHCIVLPHFNEYWDARLQGYARDAPVTTVEKVLLGLGIAAWVLWLAAVVLLLVALLITGGTS